MSGAAARHAKRAPKPPSIKATTTMTATKIRQPTQLGVRTRTKGMVGTA